MASYEVQNMLTRMILDAEVAANADARRIREATASLDINRETYTLALAALRAIAPDHAALNRESHGWDLIPVELTFSGDMSGLAFDTNQQIRDGSEK